MKIFHLILVLMAVVLLGGCGDYARYLPWQATEPLQIQSVEKKGTVVTPGFGDAVYYPDRDGVLHVVSEASGTDAATGASVRQVLMMRIFWVPVGGKTSFSATSVNFTFRYLVISEGSAAQYEGAGFVRLYDEPKAVSLPLRVVDADLRLTEKTAKFEDVLKRSRVVGNLTARRDDNAALERTLRAEQEFFAATLEIAKSSTRPASAPAAESAPATTSAPATQP